MNDQLIPVIDSDTSESITYLLTKEANEIFNFRFDIDSDISMNIKSTMNKSIIYYNKKDNHFEYDQLLNLSFKNFDEESGIFIPLYVIILIDHKSKNNNKFIMILSRKNLRDQFELYNDFEKYYSRFKSLFDFLDSDIGLSIYYNYNDENNNKIAHLSVLSDEDYELYNLLITALSKMVLELDNSDHKLFKYQEDFSWTDLLSDYILSIEEK
nr:MAG TPA: hypothetical protein [Caudoviricetes sp.]